jgi:SPP1 gp7 family putative phage head morphogenesis protein
MLRGETLTQLRDRISPRVDLRTVAQGPQRDLYKTLRRNAEALVRTSTLTVMREAHLDVYEANADVISGVQWCATLDNRTTPMCRGLDLLEWSLPDYEPKGHSTKFPGTTPHWNCRSVIVPVTKSWEQLAREAGGDAEAGRRMDELYRIHPSERASMGGPVSESMSYREWFEGQTAERQAEAGKPMGVEEFSEMLSRPSRVVIDFLSGLDCPPPPLSLEDQSITDRFFDGVHNKVVGKIGSPVPIEKDDIVDARRTINYLHGANLQGNSRPLGMCFFVRDPASGDRKPIHIAINENYVRKLAANDFAPGYTRYFEMAEQIPSEHQLMLTLCHEIAHANLPNYHGTDGYGHGDAHEMEMLRLMEILVPGFSLMPRRKLR